MLQLKPFWQTENHMTAIKNGIKCTIRTPWKTILFSVVLVFLSVLLTVSLSIFTAVRIYLNDCNAYFHTIAKLEYIGSEYPDASVYDPALSNAVEENAETLQALLKTDGVIAFEPDSNAAAIIDGIHRWDLYTYAPDRAVLRIYNPFYDERLNTYLALITKEYYSRLNHANKLVMFRADAVLGDASTEIEKGKSYYVIGSFYRGQTMHPWFYTDSATFTDGDETLTLPPITAAEEGSPQSAAVQTYADQLRLMNDCCRVQFTASLEDEPRFHQQILTVADGRVFTASEYAERARVCVLPQRIASALQRGVGDTIDLTVYTAADNLYDPSGWQQTDAGAYKIVGIYTGTEEDTYQIFLPDASVTARGITPVTGYLLGTFRLENDQAERFMLAAEPLVERGFRVTVYDQGYAAATEPMRELMFISIIFLAVCLLLTVAAHALQSHLFISRQRDAAKTMHALGSGKAHVLVYFLGVALLLVLIASVIGAGVAKLLEQRVFAVLARFASQFADVDLRFSDSRLSLVRTLAFAPYTPLFVYLLSVGLMLFGSALFTLVFALRSLKDEHTAKKKRRAMLQRVTVHNGKSSRLSGVLKYAVLSIRRGVVRTVAVLVLCLVVAAFFGQLNASLDGYRAQLNAYRANAVITGFATDIKGQKLDRLTVKSASVQDMLDTGLLSAYSVSDTRGFCKPIGIAQKADGTPCEPPTYDIPEIGTFAYETLEYNITNSFRWVNTSSISDSPQLYYAKVKDIQWYDGHSEETFTNGSLAVGALPQQVMEENGIALGDTVRFLAFSDYFEGYMSSDFEGIHLTDVQIVATYATTAAKPILYAPFDRSNPKQIRRYATYDSFLFTLNDTQNLDALREALSDSGFTYVNSGERSKPFAIIEDEMYLNTTHSMERQIQYVSVLYDSLYIIAGVIGLVLAWLLTLSRRQEIAIMRAMGTQPIRIFLNFSVEQIVLSGAGLLLGVALTAAIGYLPTAMLWLLVCAFFGAWNLSTLLCLIVGLTKQSYASLTEPE